MRYHSDKWKRIWTDVDYTDERMRDIFEQLRVRAKEEALAPLTGEQLRNVLRSMPPSKAQGVDALSPPRPAEAT